MEVRGESRHGRWGKAAECPGQAVERQWKGRNKAVAGQWAGVRNWSVGPPTVHELRDEGHLMLRERIIPQSEVTRAICLDDSPFA